MESKLRIAELQFAVEIALEDTQYSGQSSARIRSVPDTRAIRYYTTLGILDRAAEMRGRTAYYGRRHLLQLVAIKRLQADGMTLVEIQQKLTGLSNRKLTGIAKLSTEFWELLEKRISKRAGQTKKAAKAKAESIEQAESAVEKKRPVKEMTFFSQANVSTVSDSGSARSRVAKKSESKSKRQPASKSRSADAFWAAPVEVLSEPTQAELIPTEPIIVRNETRIEFPNGIAISIPNSSLSQEATPEIIQHLLPEVQKLASKIESIQRRQNSGTKKSSNENT